MAMIFTNDIHGRLQLINVIGFLAIPVMSYFDQIILGVGIALTTSGILSAVAFACKTEPLYYDWTRQKVFNWLFEQYSNRASNFCYALFLLTLGISFLVHELTT